MRKWTIVLLIAPAMLLADGRGMGSVMHETAQRFWALYYAAKVKNWQLAAYELHELEELLEAAKARPALLGKLKTYKTDGLEPLKEVVAAKDSKRFNSVYKRAQKACNRCHKASGYGYIRFKLPKYPPPSLSF